MKFFDHKVVPTVAESVEKLLTEFIIPNNTIKMPWQEFRDNELWCLEVDDLFKANKEGINLLIKWCKKCGDNRKTVSMEDVIVMFSAIDIKGTENDRKIAQAYSFCKMTIVDEME